MRGIKQLQGIKLKSMDIWILVAILVIFTISFSMVNPRFFTFNTLQSIGFQFPELGILTIGMAVTMIVGGINLSCIASANLSAIVMVSIMTRLIPEGADSAGAVCLAIVVGIAVSVAMGVLNGIIIAYFEVPDILATLSTQLLILGLNLGISRGNIFSAHSDIFRLFGNGDIGGVPIPLILFLLCAILAAIVLNRTVHGKSMYIYGSNATVSAFNGTGKAGMIIKTYALSGFFVGIAAIVMTSRFNSASAEYASSYLLQTVLIAVLAGVNPEGGKGRVFGLVVAIILIQVISTGFNLMRVDSHLGTAIWGIILLLSVLMGKRNK